MPILIIVGVILIFSGLFRGRYYGGYHRPFFGGWFRPHPRRPRGPEFMDHGPRGGFGHGSPGHGGPGHGGPRH